VVEFRFILSVSIWIMEGVTALLIVALLCQIEGRYICDVCICLGGFIKCENRKLSEIPELTATDRPSFINFKGNPRLKCAELKAFHDKTHISIADDCDYEKTVTTPESTESSIVTGKSPQELITVASLSSVFGVLSVVSMIISGYCMYKNHKILQNIQRDIIVIKRQQVGEAIREGMYVDIAHPPRQRQPVPVPPTPQHPAPPTLQRSAPPAPPRAAEEIELPTTSAERTRTVRPSSRERRQQETSFSQSTDGCSENSR
jgi:hypothetical protein